MLTLIYFIKNKIVLKLSDNLIENSVFFSEYLSEGCYSICTQFGD